MHAPFLSAKPQHPPADDADLSSRLPRQRLPYAPEGLALPTPAAEGLLRVALVAVRTSCAMWQRKKHGRWRPALWQKRNTALRPALWQIPKGGYAAKPLFPSSFRG
jgi:hypothetical protein